MAIVNSAHITPYAEIDAERRALADDLIFDRREDALARFIEFFEELHGTAETRADPTADMTPQEAIHWQILHRRREGIEDLVARAIESGGGDNDAAVRAQRRPAACDEGGRRPLRRRRADPAVRAPVRRGDEARRYRSSRHISIRSTGRARGPSFSPPSSATSTTSARTSSARSSRTTATRCTTWQAGPRQHDHREGGGGGRRRDRPVGAPRFDVQTDAALRPGAPRAGTDLPGPRRRSGDQPVVREDGPFVDDGELYGPGLFYCKDAFEGLSAVEALVDPGRRTEFVADRLEDIREDWSVARH